MTTTPIPAFRQRAVDAIAAAIPLEERDRLHEIVDIVLATFAPSLAAGKPVVVPGVGVLKSKLRRRRIVAPGPTRGMAIEERVAQLQHPAVVSAGEPFDYDPVPRLRA